MISIRWLSSESLDEGGWVRIAKSPGVLALRTQPLTYLAHDSGGAVTHTGMTPEEKRRFCAVVMLGVSAMVQTGRRNAARRRANMPSSVRVKTAAGFK